MNRWWNEYGSQTFGTILALAVGFWLHKVEAEPLMEASYFAVNPWKKENLEEMENRLVSARILELEQRVLELRQENSQLKQLLNYVRSEKIKGVVAPVIDRNIDVWWDGVTLGKGSNEGIKEGDIVTGIGGIIGRVVKVTPNTSRVLLISNSNSRVSVSITRSRDLGYLKGDGGQKATMHFFEEDIDIKVGDVISTSAISNLYPSGMAVGRVKSIEKNKSTFPTAEIELSSPIDILEWATIVSHNSNK